MKKIIIIIGLIFITFLGYSQNEGENININNAKLNNRLYSDKSGGIDTLIVPDADSMGQYMFMNMRDPINDLDGANKRYVDNFSGFLPSSTSIIYGGELSIISSTTVQVAAGKATFVDNYTDPVNPTINSITWNDTILTITNIATQVSTFIWLDVNGDFAQSSVSVTMKQKREYVQIGVAVHTNLTSVSKVSSLPVWNKDVNLLAADIVTALGSRFKVSGNQYSASGDNLHIKRAAGEIFGVGLNYADDKQNPNVETTTEKDTVTFLRGYRTAGASVFIPTNEINTTQYDPNGDGVLVDIPDGYWTAHKTYYSPELDITVVQDGQHVYSSQKKVVDAFAADSYDNLPELWGVAAMTAIINVKDATDLSDPDQASFVNTGVLGDKDLMQIDDYDRFASGTIAFSGMSDHQQDITFIESTGTVYLEVERVGGGDLSFIFSEKTFILDCTTGSGTSGKARIALLAGSDNEPRIQYVYITRLGETGAQLNLSESKPSGEIANFWNGSIQSVATFISEGNKPHSSRRLTEALLHGGQGAISRERERIRVDGSKINSNDGPEPLFTIVEGTPDSAYFSIGAGIGYQLNRQTILALDGKVDGMRILNPNTTALKNDFIYNLDDLTEDAAGNLLNNTCFNLVGVLTINSADSQELNWLGFLLPNGVYGYTDITGAAADVNNTATTSVPVQIQETAVLLFRVPVSLKNGQWENLANTVSGLNYYDLRGVALGASSGGVGGAPVAQVNQDGLWELQNSSDNSKIMKFDASNITTATTRTLTIPDISDTIAVLSDIKIIGLQEVTDVNSVTTNAITTGGLTSTAKLTLNSNSYQQHLYLTRNSIGAQIYPSGNNFVVYPVSTADYFFTQGLDFGVKDISGVEKFRVLRGTGNATFAGKVTHAAPTLSTESALLDDIEGGTRDGDFLTLAIAGVPVGAGPWTDSGTEVYTTDAENVIVGNGTSTTEKILELRKGTEPDVQTRWRFRNSTDHNLYIEHNESNYTWDIPMTIGINDKITLNTGTGINEFSIDGTLAGNSDDAVPTEKAVKTYVDASGGATDLSLGTITATTIDVNSSTGTNATLLEANTTQAGILGSDKWDEIVANTSFKTTPSTVITAGTNISWTGNTLNATAGSVSFGLDNEIPFTNAGTDDFDYNSGLTYDGVTLELGTGDQIKTPVIEVGTIQNINGTNSANLHSSTAHWQFLQAPQLDLTSDPATPIDGQWWYNSTSDVFKGRVNGATVEFAGGSSLWQSGTGYIAPATLTDEVRIGTTTDYGIYSLQINGDMYCNSSIRAPNLNGNSHLYGAYLAPTGDPDYGRTFVRSDDVLYFEDKYGYEYDLRGIIQRVLNGAKTASFTHDAETASIGAYRVNLASTTVSIHNLSSGMQGTIFLDFHTTTPTTLTVNTYSDGGTTGLTEVVLGSTPTLAINKATSITYTCANDGTNTQVYLVYGQE